MKRLVILILATASVLLAANPAIKYLSSQSSTSILSLSGMSYWVAGQETDSQNLTQLGSSGAGDAQYGSTSGADSNDPVSLSWTSGDGDHVYLPGTSGNYLSHPDSVAVSPTGDTTWQVEVALDDWSPASSQTFFSKQNGGSLSYLIYLQTNGTIRFYWSSTTVTWITEVSATISASDGEKLYIRVTFDVDNGASDYDLKFWTSADGENFSQLGTTQNGGAVTDIYDGSGPLELGSRASGTVDLTTGSFYSAYIWSSDIGDTATSSAGTPVMHWEASSMTQSGGADEESGSNWTINRSASGLKSTLVTRPVIVFDSAASTCLTVAGHDDLDMGSGDFTWWIYCRMQGATSVSFGRFMEKDGDGYYTNGTSLTLRASVTGLSNWNDGTTTQSQAFLGSFSRNTSNTEFEIAVDGVGTGTTDTAGSLGSTGAMLIGQRSALDRPQDLELFAAGVLKGTSLSSDQLASLKTELDTLLGGRSGE